MNDHPESFRSITRALLAKQGLSIEDLAYNVSRDAKQLDLHRAGTSVSSVQKHLAGTANASPSRDLMRLVAARLGIFPERFAEYRLAEARDLLDEQVVGFDVALDWADQAGMS